MTDLEITKDELSSEIGNVASGLNDDLYRSKDNLSPMISITYFFVISLGYLFLQIFAIVRSDELEIVNNVKTNKLYLISYCLLILLGSFFINFNISKSICPNNTIDIYTILLNTLFPWLFIFGSIYGILLVFDTWHRPFSNTLGYLIIKILQVEKIFLKLLNDNKSSSGDSDELIKAIVNMETNKSIFINELDEDPELYREFMSQLRNAKIIASNSDQNPNETELFKLVVIKNSIGRFVWFFLAGIVISTITYNNMINSSCNETKTSILKRYQSMS